MIENLKRIREPLGWAVVAFIAAGLVLGVVRLVTLMTVEKVPVFAAFQEIGLSLMNLTLVIALIALVSTCLFLAPATRRALRLAWVGAIVVGLGAALQLVCFLLGVAASANAFGVIVEFLGGLLDVALKAVGAGVLWVLHRGVDAGRLEAAPGLPTEIATSSPKSAPVWRPERATGTAWRSASEAAAGVQPGMTALTNEPTPPAPPQPPAGRWQSVTQAQPANPPSDTPGQGRWRPVERPSEDQADTRG